METSRSKTTAVLDGNVEQPYKLLHPSSSPLISSRSHQGKTTKKRPTLTYLNMQSPVGNAKKAMGKGLGWNDDELLALAQAAPRVCMNPAVGKQMSRKEMGERLRKELTESTLRPSDACTCKQTKDNRDDRRWDGRSGEACFRKWAAMRADCTAMYGITKRISSLNLTGNFDKKALMRMAMVEFSCGTQVNGHLYDIGNNEDYMFTNKFEYSVVFDFLVGNTTLITGSAFHNNQDVDAGQLERPVGNKEAKRRKVEERKEKKKGSAGPQTVQQSAHDISKSIAKTNELLEARQAGKIQLAREQLMFEKEKWVMSQASNLLGEGSGASAEEKEIAKQLMRKKTLASLAQMFADTTADAAQDYIQNGLLPARDTETREQEVPQVDDGEGEGEQEGSESKESDEDAETQPPPAPDNYTQYEVLASPFECNESELEK